MALAVFATLFPGLIVSLWLRTVFARAEPGVWWIVLGYGYFLGLFATVWLLLLWDALGLGLHASLTMWVWVVVLSAWAIIHGREVWTGRGTFGQTCWVLPTGWQGYLWLFLLALVLFRLVVIALEGFWRPLTPWDAWVVWIHRAEVWAEFRTIVPFVGQDDWLHASAQGAYTIDAHHYPKTVSVIATWVALIAGGWNEDLLFLPWLGCLGGLLAGLYGLVRYHGGVPLEAMLLVYVVASLPLIASHTALYGYADLWMAAALALGTLALWAWRETGGLALLALAFAMLFMLPALKVEGLVWLLVIMAGFVMTSLRKRVLWSLLASTFVLVLASIAWLWSSGGVLDLVFLGEVVISFQAISVPGMISVGLGYSPDATGALAYAMFGAKSWHLFWFFFFPFLLLSAVFCNKLARMRTAVWTLLIFAVSLAFLFLLTDVADWVVSFTVVNRLLLHFTPLAAFFIWMALRCFVRLKGVNVPVVQV